MSRLVREVKCYQQLPYTLDLDQEVKLFIHLYFYLTLRQFYVLFVVCFFNPLSANMELLHIGTVVISDSCNSGHSENYESNFEIFVLEFEIFYKMVYKSL